MQPAAISRNPKVLGLLDQAAVHINANRIDIALEKLREAVKLDPRNAEILQLTARWAARSNSFDEPIRLLKQAIRLRPKAWQLYFDLGQRYSEHHKVAEAIQMFRKAAQLGPPDSASLVELAQLYAHTGAKKERDEALKLARIKYPNDVRPYSLLGTVALNEKNYSEAEACYRKIVDSNLPDPNMHAYAWNYLGKALEKLDRLDEAWDAYACSRQIRYSQMDPDALTVVPSIRKNENALTRAHVERWKSMPKQTGSRQHALICGFPRSGTTMLEVMLGTHPEVETLEETYFLFEANDAVLEACPNRDSVAIGIDSITEDRATAIRNRYLARCKDYRRGRFERSVIIDKHPLRTHMAPFFLWLHPGSKIIVPIRDPRDVVASNFTQDMMVADLVSLDRIVSYYEACFNFWFKVRDWVGDAALEIRYEDTVGDLQGQVTRVLEFLGLEWDPAILGFHERAQQTYVATPSYLAVSRPVTMQSVGRWRRYESQLRPVLDRLEPFVKAFGYEPS